MKRSLLTLLLIITASLAYSQYEGFENWTQYNALNLDDYQTSVNDGGGATLGTTTRSTDAYIGTYSVKLETKLTTSGDTSFGYFISGDPQNFTPGQPVTIGNVDSIVGYYKASILPGDSVLFIAATTFMGSPSGGGTFNFNSSKSSWTRFAFYVGSPMADSLMVGAATGDPLNDFDGIPGTWIQFDNIQLKSSIGVQQNIVNHSFENWSTIFWEELDDWKTSNQWYIGEPVLPVSKTTDSYSGLYALEMNVVLRTNGDTTWTSVTNGNWGDNYLEGGVPYTSSPTAMEFYYKYFPAGSDTAWVNCEFKKSGFPSQWAGAQLFGTTSTYTLYSSFIPPVSPDSLLINISLGRSPGSKLILDDLNFVFPVGTSENLILEKLVAFPNPVKDLLNVRFNLKSDKDVQIRLVDVAGKELDSKYLGKLNSGVYNHSFNTSTYSTGIYFLEFNFDGEKTVERFVVQ